MLNDEANTQNSDLHASVIEIDSSIQQPSFGRNTAINNDNISPEQGDIANNYTELSDETIQGTKDSSSSATESRTQLNDQDQTTRNGDNSYDKSKSVLIIVDSIIKHIDPRKLSKNQSINDRFQGKELKKYTTR